MIVRASVEHPLRTIAVVLAVTLALGAAATRLVPDDTPSAWLPTVDPELDAYRAFRARFGEDSFVLAVTAPVSLGDPRVVEALAEHAERLRAVEGVGAVIGPARRGSRVDALRAELPARLDAVGQAVTRASADPSPWSDAETDLLALDAEANASLAFLLLHDTDLPAARGRYARAQESALRVVMRAAPELGHALVRSDPFDRLERALAPAPEAAVRGLFWWAFARAAAVRASPGDPALLADLGRVDAVMTMILARDEELFHGGPHLYFAMRLAAPDAHGGDLEQSALHFEEARRLSHGLDLLPWVLEAQTLAPLLAATPAGAPLEAVLAAQRRAWARFTGNLQQALVAPRSYDDAHPESNAVARERARALLADPGAAGVIPPADAHPGLELGAELPPPDTAWLLDGPLERFLVSDDEQRAALLVIPRADLEGAARTAVVDRVEAALAGSPLGPFELAGPEVMTHDLDHASQASFKQLFPLVFLVMCVVLWLSLGSLRVVVAIQACVGATVLWTLGLMWLGGRTLNLVLVVLPAVLAVVGTAYALRLVARFFDHDPAAPEDPRAAWVHAARESALPCFLCALTTAGGFLSLATSAIPPVRDLGIFAAVGVLVAFVLTFTLVPALLSLGRGRVRPGAHPSHVWSAAAAARYVARLDRLAFPAVVVSSICLAVGLHGLSSLRVESDVLRFFPEDHRLLRSTSALEAAGFGLTPFEVWLEGPTEQVLSPNTLAALRRFLDTARDEPLVLEVVSPLDARGLTQGDDALTGALLAGAIDAGQAGPALVRSGATLSLRATLACSTTGSSDACHALAERLREALPRAGFPPGLKVELTGVVPLLVRVQVLLVDTQISSFSASLLAITLVLLVSFRSLGLALLSVLPNAAPVLLTLGGMGFAGLPLDTATVTVAAIALGLLVDDAIHLLYHVRQRAPGEPVAAPLARTLAVVGRPVVTTTATIAVGFGVFALSPFRPTRDFGVLIAITSVTALLFVLVLVPALLLLLDRLRGKGGAPPA